MSPYRTSAEPPPHAPSWWRRVLRGILLLPIRLVILVAAASQTASTTRGHATWVAMERYFGLCIEDDQ